MEVPPTYQHPRRYLWYLAAIVLILFILRNPEAAGHLARQSGDLLSVAFHALWKLAGSL